MSNWSSPRARLVVARPAASFTMRRAGCTHTSSHALFGSASSCKRCRCPLNNASPVAFSGSFNKVPHRLMTLAARMRCSESRYALGSSVQREVNRAAVRGEMTASCGACVQVVRRAVQTVDADH